MATIINGTIGNDPLNGTAGDDVINGLDNPNGIISAFRLPVGVSALVFDTLNGGRR